MEATGMESVDTKGTSQLLTAKSPILDTLAEQLKLVWKKLALSCKFYEDEIDFIMAEKKEDVAQAKHFLILWIERRDQNEATLLELQSSLAKAQLDISIV
jgi:hypothetical protein